MRIDNLPQFISLLEEQGELARITVETDPHVEIAAVTDRVCKMPGGGKALLFQKPAASHFPIATNLFGSLRRVCLALEVESLDHITERLAQLLKSVETPLFEQLDRQIGALSEFARFAPLLSGLPCSDHVVMDPPDLSAFPFLQTWPEDGSAEGFPRYITLPLVVTTDPQGVEHNCGLYRAQLRGKDRLAIRWKAGSDAAAHQELFRQAGRPMPVAIALGGPPAALFSALFPLPGALDEMTFAGFLRNAPLDLAACRTVPLHVPAGSEIVIEGYVDPGETVTEGPFGNHTGAYSAAGEAALLRVTAISHRPEAIVPATIVGPPPMEDCWMARAWEALLLAFLRRLVPAVARISFPREWVFHQSAVISLDAPRPGMVRETADLLWTLPWFSASRILVFVDAALDPADYATVAWRALNDTVFSRDVHYDDICSRLALDATGCHGGNDPIIANTDMRGQVARRWHEYGIPAISD
jgi:4-hydroxy-3-polyprenylbenzoate decarboxylase